jgi:HlyD family secretion protein
MGGISTDQTTNFQVKINLLPSSYKNLLQKNRHPFRPGMSTSVEIRTDRAENVLCVPIQAVALRAVDAKNKVMNTSETRKAEREEKEPNKNAQTDDLKPLSDAQKEVVFVIDAQGNAQSIIVKTGIQNDKFIQILSGVNASQTVVSAPYSAITKKLYDGAPTEKVAEKDLFEIKEE